MRESDAGLALITRANSRGETEYLGQWNHKWHAYSLIGGHREANESVWECCLREIGEELCCEDKQISVSRFPFTTLQFLEYSHLTQDETKYHWHVFTAQVHDDVLSKLPPNCAWISDDHVAAKLAADGKRISDQIIRVMKAVNEATFDLFVSHGQADNDDGSVTALIEHIRRDHERAVPNQPLKIFLDQWEFRSSEEWKRRIYRALIESKSMLAVLSPAYFQSQWCQLEFETFVEQHRKKLDKGQSKTAFYFVNHAELQPNDDQSQRSWFDDLRTRQLVDVQPWWPDGQAALLKSDVAK